MSPRPTAPRQHSDTTAASDLMHANPDLSKDDARSIFDYLLLRATTDLAFRRFLLTDPRGALQSELQLDLPEDFNIRFVENAGADLTLVLPDPESIGGELREEDLLQIGGGGESMRLREILHLLTESMTGR